MTKQDAVKVLDAVREGEAMPSSLVDRALQITGDLNDFHGEFCRMWRACGERQAEIRQTRGIRKDLYTQEDGKLGAGDSQSSETSHG
jgi:hypothetical protein